MLKKHRMCVYYIHFIYITLKILKDKYINVIGLGTWDESSHFSADAIGHDLGATMKYLSSQIEGQWHWQAPLF